MTRNRVDTTLSNSTVKENMATMETDLCEVIVKKKNVEDVPEGIRSEFDDLEPGDQMPLVIESAAEAIGEVLDDL